MNSKLAGNMKKVNFLDILTVLVRWRRLILINVVGMAVLSVIVSLLLPNWYKAKAIVLPPESEGLSFGMGAIGELAGAMLGPSGYELPMLATRSDVYVTILESDRMARSVIREHKLMERYKTDNLDRTIKKMRSHFKAEVAADGCIHVSFEARKDPELASAVTNTFIRLLDEINTETSQSKAGNTRRFIEQRLQETERDLADAENALQKFQEENNFISVEHQTETTIRGAGELLSQLLVLRIQLSAATSRLSPEHSKITDLKNRIQAYEDALAEIVRGSDQAIEDPTGEIFLTLQKVPELGVEMVRKMRDMKIQEIIFELLTQQYEQAKIRELEDTPTIAVLQRAVPPTLKSRPKRMIIVLVSVGFALIVSLFLAFTLDYLSGDDEQSRRDLGRIQSISRELRRDISFLRRSGRK